VGMSWELEDTLDRDTGSCILAPGPVRARADRQQHEPSRASSVDGRTENAGWQACEPLKQSEQACSLETIRCGPAVALALCCAPVAARCAPSGSWARRRG
jgi:hypothetical protein